MALAFQMAQQEKGFGAWQQDKEIWILAKWTVNKIIHSIDHHCKQFVIKAHQIRKYISVDLNSYTSLLKYPGTTFSKAPRTSPFLLKLSKQALTRTFKSHGSQLFGISRHIAHIQTVFKKQTKKTNPQFSMHNMLLLWIMFLKESKHPYSPIFSKQVL